MKYTYRKPTTSEVVLGIVFTTGAVIVAIKAGALVALGVLLIVIGRTHSFGTVSIKSEESK